MPRKPKPPIADERQQLIKKAEISFDKGATWAPCIRFWEHPRVIRGDKWMHRVKLGEPIDPEES